MSRTNIPFWVLKRGSSTFFDLGIFLNIDLKVVLCLTWRNFCQFWDQFLTDRIFWATFPKHSQNKCFYHVLILSTTVYSACRHSIKNRHRQIVVTNDFPVLALVVLCLIRLHKPKLYGAQAISIYWIIFATPVFLFLFTESFTQKQLQTTFDPQPYLPFT